jgi:peptide/nickel transport system substrate-binding protein
MAHGHLPRLAALLTLFVLSAGLAAYAAVARPLASHTRATDSVGALATLTWNLPYGEPSSLDPIKAYNYSENTVLGNICEGLMRMGPTGAIEPALATKVAHPSPTVWVYTVRFFDGHSLAPADVVGSLSRHVDPKLGSYYNEPWGAAIKSVKATGANQVTVTTTQPNALVNELMITGLGAIVEASTIAPQGKSFGTSTGKLECTGPYELAAWKPGASLTLVRNDRYWGPKAHAAKVVFSFITDPTAAANALLTGQIDGSYEAPLTAVDRLKSASNGRFTVGPSTQGLALISTATGLANQRQVVAAISAAVDRVGIAKTVYSGTAIPWTTIAAPTLANYSGAIFANAAKAYGTGAPDLAKAKSLVAASHYSKTIRLAYISGDPSIGAVANSVQQSLQGIGLHVTLVPLQPSAFLGLYFDPKARSHYDLVLGQTYSDLFDPAEFLFIGSLPNSSQNFPNGHEAAVTAAIEKAVASTGDARARQVVKAAALVQRDYGFVPLVQVNERLFLSTKLTGASDRFPYMYYPWAARIGAAK